MISSHSEPPFDVAVANRWFAGEFSRRAYELATKQSRTASELQQMIQLAHAAAIHWLADGTPLSAQRAATLQAIVCSKSGDFSAAQEHVTRGLALSEQAGRAQTPLDRAAILAVAAKIRNQSGQANEALGFIMSALDEAEKLTENERAAFDGLFAER